MAGWQYHPLLSIFQLGIIVSFGVALYAVRYMWHNGTSSLVGAVALLSFNNGVWVLAATLKTARTDLASKLFFYQFEFFGYWGNPSVALVLALAYAGHRQWLTRRTIGALAAIPAVAIPLTFLNPGNLLIAEPYLVERGAAVALEHEFPPLNQALTLWATVGMTAAAMIVARAALQRRVLRKPGLLVVLTIAMPLIVVTIKNLGIYPPGGDGINPTPAFASIALLMLGVAVFEYRLLELVPVGRDRAIDVLDDGYVLTDQTGEVLDTNAAARTMLTGDEHASMRGKRIETFLPDSVELEEIAETTLTVDDQDLLANCTDVVGRNGATGKVLVLRDVTELKERERELEDYEFLFEHTTDCIVQGRVQHGDPVVHRVNDAFESVFGYTNSELRGENLNDFITPDGMRDEAEAVDQAIREGDIGPREVTRQTADGPRDFLLRATGGEGKLSFAIYTDITAQKEREQELRRARERAQSERDGKEAIRQLLLQTADDHEIADNVCRLLVETHDYEAAWITRRDGAASDEGSETVTVANHGDDRGFRAAADTQTGDTTDPSDDVTRRVLDSGETVTVTEADDDADVAAALGDCGFYSVRAVPLEHDGVVYGVLSVLQADSREGFTRALVEEFADAIAFKQQISYQQEALVTDVVIEVDIRFSDPNHVLLALAEVFETEAVQADELESGDETSTYLLRGETADAERLAVVVAARDDIQEGELVAEDGESVVRVRVDRPTVGTVLSKHGGVVQSMHVTERWVDVTAQFPRRSDVSDVVDTVQNHWPDAVLQSRTERTPDREQPAVFETLTEKQEQALRAAYLTGFFDRPQQATAADVASTLDVSRSTVLHHLRHAERKVFEEAFEHRNIERLVDELDSQEGKQSS